MAYDSVFDENISSDISLSRIFDYLMMEDENPGTILDFLRMYKKDVSNIIYYSDTSPRLFSVDFINRCSMSEIDRFLDICSSLIAAAEAVHQTVHHGVVEAEHHGVVSGILLNVFKVFNVIRVGANFPSTVKRRFNCIINKNQSSTNDKSTINPYPYSGRLGNDYLRFDRMFFGVKSPGEYAMLINSMPIDEFTFFAKNCESKSMIAQRLLQEDVFACIDDTKKFIFLNCSSPFSTKDYKKGLKQLVCGGLDLEIRKYICKIIEQSGPSFISLDNDVCDLAATEFKVSMKMPQRNFNEIIMRLEISGGDNSCEWLVYDLLAKYGLDYIKKKVNSNTLSFLARNFNITDLLS